MEEAENSSEIQTVHGFVGTADVLTSCCFEQWPVSSPPPRPPLQASPETDAHPGALRVESAKGVLRASTPPPTKTSLTLHHGPLRVAFAKGCLLLRPTANVRKQDGLTETYGFSVVDIWTRALEVGAVVG